MADGSEWRTVLVGGMRQGGMTYFALDVTLPGATSCQAPATGDAYPCYLWEFPRENDIARASRLDGRDLGRRRS